MKNLVYLCLLLASMPLISCSSEEDGNQNPIIGKWKSLSEVKQNLIDGITQSVEEYPVENESDGCEFKSDGTFIETYGGTILTGTYEVSENIVSSKYDGDDVIYENEFSIESNILTIKIEDEEYTSADGKHYKTIFIYKYRKQ